jgi:hypothetical protein
VAQRWKDVLQDAGIDPVALYAGEVLFPPLIMNKSTDRIHWGCRETVDSPISGTVCNKWKIAGIEALLTFVSPEEFFQHKVLWCSECRNKLALPSDWVGGNIITATPPSSVANSSGGSGSDLDISSGAPSEADFVPCASSAMACQAKT